MVAGGGRAECSATTRNSAGRNLLAFPAVGEAPAEATAPAGQEALCQHGSARRREAVHGNRI